MAHWIRFESSGKTGFGTVEGETITVHSGDMFAAAKPTGETLKLSDVQLSTPCLPSKMICLWNNFHQLAAKNDFQQPKEPLWFLKAPNAYWPAGRPIQRPATYAGKIIYESELGVVIVIDGVGGLSNVFDQVLPSPYLLGAPPRQKRICVVGAGAIGGLLAARFALAGEEVTVIDQGAHLAAIQKNGLKLEWHDGKVHIARMKAVNKPAEAGKQDIVVLAVKAHLLDQVVRDIDSLLGPGTVVLAVQNGLPWGYLQKLGGQYDNHKLESLDPSGVLTKNIDPNRLIGCVVYPAAAAIAPGVIHHGEGER